MVLWKDILLQRDMLLWGDMLLLRGYIVVRVNESDKDALLCNYLDRRIDSDVDVNVNIMQVKVNGTTEHIVVYMDNENSESSNDSQRFKSNHLEIDSDDKLSNTDKGKKSD